MKRPPKPTGQTLHLKPSVGTRRRVRRLIEAVSAYAGRGAQPPVVAEEITAEYRKTHERFLKFLAALEQRAGRSK